MAGYYDAQGVWMHDEADTFPLTSTVLNRSSKSISDALKPLQRIKIDADGAVAAAKQHAVDSSLAADRAEAAALITEPLVAPMDEGTAALINSGTSATHAALSAEYASKEELGDYATKQDLADLPTGDGPTPPPAHRSGTDRIASLRDFGRGSLAIGIATDSTGNDGDEAPRIVVRQFGALLPSAIRRTYKTWNDTTQAHNATTVDNAGAGSGGSGGIAVQDDFNRTVSDLVGTASQSGATWGGTPARWSANGSAAVPSGQGGLSAPTPAKDCTVTAVLNVITQATVVGNIRIYAGSDASTLGASGIWAQLAISATGVASFSVWKTIGGTNTQIGSTSFTTGLTSNSPTPQVATLKIEIAVQNVTATLTAAGQTPVVITGAMTETDYGTLGAHAGVFILAGGVPLYTVDSMVIETPVTPSTFDEFSVNNCSAPGKTLAYHTTRIEAMFPAANRLDVLFIGDGHNHAASSPATFLAVVAAFVTAFQAVHPETALVFWSQNPEFAPAGNVAAHAARQRALRDWATSNGHEYIPVFEAFAAQTDGGASLVKTDGIHPTTPPSPYTAWSGSRLWADKILAAIDARRNGKAAP